MTINEACNIDRLVNRVHRLQAQLPLDGRLLRERHVYVHVYPH